MQKKIIGSFSVKEDAPSVDILPPNRIADLSVISIEHGNSTVTLQWTAPGNDYDFGKGNILISFLFLTFCNLNIFSEVAFFKLNINDLINILYFEHVRS